MKLSFDFSKKGFTLAELVIVSLLLVLFMGGLFTVLLTSRESYVSLDARSRLQFETRRVVDYIVRELRESGNISCGSSGNECPNANATSRWLNFQIARGFDQAAPCPVGAVCWGSESQPNEWVHYVITGTGANAQFVRCITQTELGSMPANYAGCRILANNINGATSTFLWDAANQTIILDLTAQVIDPELPTGQDSLPTLSSRVRLRN